jgi:glycosyltransferase involved in cell wall biosynthesis
MNTIKEPFFSLVVATVGRVAELGKLLESLSKQSFGSFEVIVADQNPVGTLEPLIAKFADRMRIIHVFSALGLSRARNCGLKHASGLYVGFPDDDCWYESDTLYKAHHELTCGEPLIGVSGMVFDERGEKVMGRWPDAPQIIVKNNVFKTAISFSFFVRRNIAAIIGGFDEELGLGSGTPWGSAEETDFLVRAIVHGKMRYCPDLVFRHPKKIDNPELILTRSYSYGAGFGRVLQKNSFPFSVVAVYLARPLAGCLLKLIQFDFLTSRFYYSTFRGRLYGLMR